MLGLLGGVWFPITGDGVMHDIAMSLPSYWLVQASHVAIGGARVGRHRLDRGRGVERRRSLVAAWAYRRDTQRY